ncbi:MFS transporter [Ochrobactrum sp. P6BS-III]|uniref:RhtX/FptX family siderophore transporter n=1 Tax=unclassified Ochrobactrum TaxID=239106 RepID=UPI000992652B|nr:PAT family beta-lactamase induction signal transducer AmpG [Ochrobactrum sp. P6BSIII]OOL15655.1 MFS transporter [Ochrobactrum sp. P6BS-III]
MIAQQDELSTQKIGANARLYTVLGGLYLAQGIPTYLLLVALPPLMRESGASRTAIGLFYLLMIPLIAKFAIAPLVDRYPLIASWGHRRSWVIVTQLLVSFGIACMAFVEPQQAGALFAICLCITLLSSLQDIATDGYAVRHLNDKTRATGNAIQAGAVALGVIVGGTLALVLFHKIGWRPTIFIVAGLSLLPLLAGLWMDETGEQKQRRDKPHASLKRFFQQPNAWLILCFALTYRASEGMVRGMEGSYLVDIGLPLSWIGYLSGAAAASAGLIGAVLAALLIRWTGLFSALVLLGLFRSLCFLAFSFNAAEIWPGVTVAMTVSAIQTFLRYMELVAIYSLFMKASSSDQPGTDFTILACAELLIYLVGSSVAGFLADKFGYAHLFTLATVLSLLGIALTFYILRRLRGNGLSL